SVSIFKIHCVIYLMFQFFLTRSKTQGKIDVFIALAGASGGAMSGMVVANSSYAALSLAGGVLAFMLIPVVIWSQKGERN
ncbi:hypothetical protein ABE222_28980, partial [Bacillus tropicus]